MVTYHITYLDNDCTVKAKNRAAAIEMVRRQLMERLDTSGQHQFDSDFWLNWRVETKENS